MAIDFSEFTLLGLGGIEKGTPVYAQAAELKEGDCVIFSGNVNPKENSIGESGAMSAPEYEITFSSLKPCK